jgi:hypothetical protein
VMCGLGLVLDAAVLGLRRLLVPWHHSTHDVRASA